MREILPEKLRVFDAQISTAFKRMSGLAVLIQTGILRSDDPRIDGMLDGIESLNDRLDRLSATMGRILEIQIDAWARERSVK